MYCINDSNNVKLSDAWINGHILSLEKEDSPLVVCLSGCHVALCFVPEDRIGDHPQGGRMIFGLFRSRVFVFELCGLLFVKILVVGC